MNNRLFWTAMVFCLAAGLCLADDWSQSFEVSGTPDVRIKVNDGHIKVTTGSASEVQVMVRARGYERDKDYKVRPVHSGNRVEVEIDLKPLERIGGNRSFEVQVTTPIAANLDLETGDGHVSLEKIKGTIKARTGDGHISAGDLEGPVEFRTGDGHISSGSIRGSLFARTGDGHISASGRFAKLDAETGDGHVEIRVEEGSVMSGHWNLRSGDGRVAITLPAGFVADLDASTSDGRIHSDFPGTVSRREDASDLRAKLNGGGNLITLRTGSGNVSISRR